MSKVFNVYQASTIEFLAETAYEISYERNANTAERWLERWFGGHRAFKDTTRRERECWREAAMKTIDRMTEQEKDIREHNFWKQCQEVSQPGDTIAQRGGG